MNTIDPPEEGTEVLLMTKPPAMLLKATFSKGVFRVNGHWSIKELALEHVDFWDYAQIR